MCSRAGASWSRAATGVRGGLSWECGRLGPREEAVGEVAGRALGCVCFGCREAGGTGQVSSAGSPPRASRSSSSHTQRRPQRLGAAARETALPSRAAKVSGSGAVPRVERGVSSVWLERMLMAWSEVVGGGGSWSGGGAGPFAGCGGRATGAAARQCLRQRPALSAGYCRSQGWSLLWLWLVGCCSRAVAAAA